MSGEVARRGRWILVSVAGAALVIGAVVRLRTRHGADQADAPADVGFMRALHAALRQLGLQPQVSWITTARQVPGTVVSVQPAAQIPAGSTVTVTASLQPSSTRTSPGSPVTPAPSASPGNPSSHGKGKGKGQGGGKDNG